MLIKLPTAYFVRRVIIGIMYVIAMMIWCCCGCCGLFDCCCSNYKTDDDDDGNDLINKINEEKEEKEEKEERKYVVYPWDELYSENVCGVLFICIDQAISNQIILSPQQRYHMFKKDKHEKHLFNMIKFEILLYKYHKTKEYLQIGCYSTPKLNPTDFAKYRLKTSSTMQDMLITETAFIYVIIYNDIDSIKYVQQMYSSLNWLRALKYCYIFIWYGDHNPNHPNQQQQDIAFWNEFYNFLGKSYWKKVAGFNKIWNDSKSVNSAMERFVNEWCESALIILCIK